MPFKKDPAHLPVVDGTTTDPDAVGVLGQNETGGIAVLGASVGTASVGAGSGFLAGSDPQLHQRAGAYGESNQQGVVGHRVPSAAGDDGALGFLGGLDPKFPQLAGVYGQSKRQGVMGLSTDDIGTGVFGGNFYLDSNYGIGVRSETLSGVGLQGDCGAGGLAGKFNGNVEITGNLDMSSSISHSKFSGDVEIAGNLNMSSRSSDITLGDVAEAFTTQDGGIIEPGTVVMLNQHGLVRPADAAYDTKVAGVVSGADNYRPTIVLDKQSSQASRLL